MKLKLILATALFATAVPAWAQGRAQAQATSGAVSASHQAAATRVVDRLWPLGTYRRMMDGTMSKMMDSMMQSMFGMKASDMVPPEGRGAAGKDIGDKTMIEIAEEKDPHFRERMKISMDVMMQELVPMMEEIEPSIRDSLSHIYARDYSEKQLAELDAFLATPTGQQFGSRWMMSFVDPEMVANMSKIAPTMMKAMPQIMKKMEAATAHLPPPPKTEE